LREFFKVRIFTQLLLISDIPIIRAQESIFFIGVDNFPLRDAVGDHVVKYLSTVIDELLLSNFRIGFAPPYHHQPIFVSEYQIRVIEWSVEKAESGVDEMQLGEERKEVELSSVEGKLLDEASELEQGADLGVSHNVVVQVSAALICIIRTLYKKVAV